METPAQRLILWSPGIPLLAADIPLPNPYTGRIFQTVDPAKSVAMAVMVVRGCVIADSAVLRAMKGGR